MRLPGGPAPGWQPAAPLLRYVCGGCQGTVPVCACQTLLRTLSLTPSSAFHLSAGRGSPQATPAYLLIPRLTLCLFYLCFPRVISKTTSVSTTQMHSVISLFSPPSSDGDIQQPQPLRQTVPHSCCIINCVCIPLESGGNKSLSIAALMHWCCQAFDALGLY